MASSKLTPTEKRLKAEDLTSNLILKLKYARWLEDKKRRENWDETVNRTLDMFRKKFSDNEEVLQKIEHYKKFIFERKIVPAMRVLQFAGDAIEKDNSRVYNCAYTTITSIQDFYEIFFLLLGGTGVGFSLKQEDYSKLPCIQRNWSAVPDVYTPEDSRQGWCQAVVELLRSYMGERNNTIIDLSQIRRAGMRLKTSGGLAPGPEPLRICLDKIRKLLDNKKDGEQLESIEIYDIICHISDSVLAGGIRRSSLIALFPPEDEKMLNSKTRDAIFGNPDNPQTQRYRCNNSIILDRSKLTKEEFQTIWKYVSEAGKRDGSGEPGFFFGVKGGTNPCAEVGLRPKQFCCLGDINGSNIIDQNDFNQRCEAAAFFTTLQASYTYFPDLRPIWKETVEKEALIGVGIAGIVSGIVLDLDIKKGAQIVKDTNEEISKLIGINPAARCCVVKPDGNTGVFLSTSSGVHPPHSKYYIRHIRINKIDPILDVLMEFIPELIEPEAHNDVDVVLKIPMKTERDCVTRDTETAIEFLERVKLLNQEWIKPGHRYGDIQNNVSATNSIRDHEWEEVGEWMWENREYYNAIANIKADTTFYKHMPFEACSKEKYEELLDIYIRLDLSQLSEDQDNTNHLSESACSTEYCERPIPVSN